MSWLRLHYHTDGAAQAWNADALVARCEELGAVSVSIEPGAGEEILEPGVGETPMWNAALVSALFPLDVDLDRVRGMLPAPVRAEFVGEDDWTQRWRQHAVDRCFGQRLRLVPRDAPPHGDTLAEVRLDPGLAFGTGGHPTTAMCLEWLATHVVDGASVVDYGCGSGILAIAAAKLGAARVIAADVDPQAMVATGENARFNGVVGAIEIVAADSWVPDESYDIVIANILSGALIDLADRLTRLVRTGGRIVLSGILEAQAGSVLAAYRGLVFGEPSHQQGWVMLHGRRA